MKNQSANMFTDSITGLANVLALLAAILATPHIDDWSHRWIMGVIADTYGPDLAVLGRWLWMVLLGAMVFFISRAFIALALMIISSWVLLRFGALI